MLLRVIHFLHFGLDLCPDMSRWIWFGMFAVCFKTFNVSGVLLIKFTAEIAKVFFHMTVIDQAVFLLASNCLHILKRKWALKAGTKLGNCINKNLLWTLKYVIPLSWRLYIGLKIVIIGVVYITAKGKSDQVHVKFIHFTHTQTKGDCKWGITCLDKKNKIN